MPKVKWTDPIPKDLFKKQNLFFPIFLFVLMMSLSIGGFFYNGKTVILSCTKASPTIICQYQISFLGFVIEQKENLEYLGWKEGRHSFYIQFKNSNLHLNILGDRPPTDINTNGFNISYDPFSEVLLWILVFIPSLAALIWSLIFFSKWILIEKMDRK